MPESRVGVVWDTPYNSAKDVKEMLHFAQRSLISIAIEEHDRAERDGLDKKAVIRTDNRWYKPLSQIKPFGKVEWTSRAIPTEVLKKIYINIIKHSPIDTGLYMRHNLVYVGGKLVAKTYGQLAVYLKTTEIEANKEIWFINSMPYARKLERHAKVFGSNTADASRKRRKGRGPGALKPNGAYAMAARSAKSLAGQIGFIDYVNFANGQAGISLPKPPRGMRTHRATDGRPYVYPSIRIKPFATGITQ